jgi:hypothetical protein
MSSPTPGSDPNHPQGNAPQGQPGWSAPQGPPPQDYGTPAHGAPQQGYGAPQQGYGDPQQGYGAGPVQGYGDPAQGYGAPAPAYSGAPDSGTAQKPGMVTAAGIIGIVWGGLGLLFGLLALTVAFSLFGGLYGLLVLLSVVVSGALLYAGIQVVQGRSPRLLLLISYVAIGINLLTMIWGATQGASIVSGLLGFVVPGIVVFLLLNAQSKQYYASRGISY